MNDLAAVPVTAMPDRNAVRDEHAQAAWLSALPECQATVIDGTAAVAIGNGFTGDVRLYGAVILKDAGPATLTITGLRKLAQSSAPAAAGNVVFSGVSTEDKFIPLHGCTNDGGACTATVSVAGKAILFWRPASVYPPVRTCMPARNALPMGLYLWNTTGSQKWTKQEINGGTVTVNGDTVTCATNGATGRAFMEFDVTSILGGNNLNKVIAFSVEVVSAVAGSTTNGAIGLAGTNTVLSGSNAANVPAGGALAGSRLGFRCMLSAMTSGNLRIGIGINSAEGSAVSITYRNPVLEVIDWRSSGPYGEAIPYASDALFDFLPNITYSGGDAGLITYDRSESVQAFGEPVLAVGDSYGNDAGIGAGDDGDWPDQIRKLRPELAIINRCNSGWTLAQMAASIDSWIAAPDLSTWARRPSKAVVQGGINDILASASLAHNPVGAMYKNERFILKRLEGAGMSPEDITCVNIAPAETSASYSVANGHGAKITNFNSALRNLCNTVGYRLANIWDLLRAGPNSQVMAPRYDVGDHLHPNSPDGFGQIGVAIDLAQRTGRRYRKN